MELQGLQDSLKLEIQCHQKLVAQMKQDPQNGDLKKQLHERQSRISALSEKQKLAVRSCPVGNTKPISLIKPPNQSIAISVVPAKNPVPMVTAHSNGQKAASPEPPQTAPINLQTASKAGGRRVSETSSSQILGPVTAGPIKVPQVSSLHRLAGQASRELPQVRPKTLIPDSVSPCREQPSSQPQPLQKATMVSIKNAGPALPTANNTVCHVQLPNGQSVATSLSEPASVSPVLTTAGVAYAIISTSPGNSTGTAVSVISDAMKGQPLLISADSKVIIIQPQVQSQSQPEIKTEPKKASEEPVQSSPPPAKKKKAENPEKIAFMVALGLVTTEHLEEIQSKRQERKRRSTANPAYSGLFEPERKRLASNYLNNPLILTAGANEDLCWKDDIVHDEHCAVCKDDGELQPCDTCSRAYHPDCLDPPLKTPPKGMWVCPKCQKKVLNEDSMAWPENLAIVHSYITHKAVKEEEKRKLLKGSVQLKSERKQLDEKERQLDSSITKCVDLKNSLLAVQRGTQASLERLKALIRLIQRDQVIQVTMTATTTAASPLLTIPWIKPSSCGSPPPVSATSTASNPAGALQKGLPQAQGNN
ncbi:PHD finger protein 21B-like isoform X2 [Acipenser ruthenus]|uniref:PHD finger protein 21B-like isoform X2 n=1 Tax=Acipenser ruthenus TaxID=7906 RepID=UPI00145B1A6B|nr:PHD finger protein 21B-like isoform X2 [Acipenser ruthenus]